MDGVVSQTSDINELLDWLQEFSDRQRDRPLAVMLIDDDLFLADAYANALRLDGMEVNVFTAPVTALEALEVAIPDLILMDLHMPEVDGIRLASIIRQSRRHLSVPIVFLSGEQNEERRLAARRAGGDDFIEKPVTVSTLACVVRLRAERARALRTIVERDRMTGLFNHGVFKDRVTQELERSRRFGSSCCIAMLDIDRFKEINDKFGHPVGDRVIRTLSRALAARIGSNGFAGRCGGDEFGVFLADTDLCAAHKILNDIREAFHSISFKGTSSSFVCSFSAGVAESRGGDVQGLIHAADSALYKAKLSGANCIEGHLDLHERVPELSRGRRETVGDMPLISQAATPAADAMRRSAGKNELGNPVGIVPAP